MRRRSIVWIFLFSAVFAAGCKSRSDLVEAELRLKDRQLREVAAERDRCGALNEAYEATMRGGPNCPTPGRGGMAPVDVRDIQVGRGTGGVDEDNCAGDEGVMVVIVPRDVDGSPVKAPGQARVTVVAKSPEGLKMPVSTWDVTGGYLKRNWKTGLLSTGYYVSLPWQVLPPSENLRIVVQFHTPDGAQFEAERDIQVRLPQLRPNIPAPPKPPDPGIIPGTPTSIPVPPQFDPTAPLPPPEPWNGPTISEKVPAVLGKPVAAGDLASPRP